MVSIKFGNWDAWKGWAVCSGWFDSTNDFALLSQLSLYIRKQTNVSRTFFPRHSPQTPLYTSTSHLQPVMSNVEWDSKVVIGSKARTATVTKKNSDLNGKW